MAVEEIGQPRTTGYSGYSEVEGSMFDEERALEYVTAKIRDRLSKMNKPVTKEAIQEELSALVAGDVEVEDVKVNGNEVQYQINVPMGNLLANPRLIRLIERKA